MTELEERILSDDGFYEELLIAEDELIDQYLLGALSEAEQHSFVSHFLITEERREKLRFAKTLRKYLDAKAEAVLSESPVSVPGGGHSAKRGWFFSLFPVTGHPALRVSLAAASLVVILGFSWIVLTNWRSNESASVNPRSTFIATLSSSRTRDSGETTRLSIPSDIEMVRLQLPLELSSNGYESYSAELKTFENTTHFSRDNLQPQVEGTHRVVTLDVPAQILKAGDFQILLSGVGKTGTTEPVGRYPFRVVR